MVFLDALFFLIIISSICVYVYVGNITKKREIRYKKDENFESNDEKKYMPITNGNIYESDKYKDLYENLPWEDENDDLCNSKSMDKLRLISSGEIRRKSKMTIY